MQLCLMIEGQEGVTWPQWVALAQACEAHDIPALFRSDHYLNLDGSHPERGSLDAWGTLCALAAVTSRLRLGTMVSPATFRHPSVLAKLVTTADRISGGRVELGLGAGWHEPEHEAYGFPLADIRSRMDVLEEQLQVVLGNWSVDGPFSFEGAHYHLRELDAQPKPVRREGGGRVPVILGGTAGPRSARLAAAYADEYNTVFVGAEEVGRRRERVAAACDAAGREMLAFSVMTGFLVGADDRQLHERAARLEARAGFAAGSLLRDPPEGWIVGTEDQAVAQLRELADAGVDRVMCQHLLHDDLDAVALIGEGLAPLVG